MEPSNFSSRAVRLVAFSRWTTGHAGGLVLEFELEFHRQGREERAVHAAQLLDLALEIFPVGGLALLQVQVADVVELVFNAQRTRVGAEPAERLDELRGDVADGGGVIQADLFQREAVERILRRAGADKRLDDAVRQQVNELGGLGVGADDGFRAVVKPLHVAVAAHVVVGGEQHLVRARLGAVEIAPANRGAVVRQHLLEFPHLPADEHAALEDRVFHDRSRGEFVRVGVQRRAGEIGPEPVVEFLGGERRAQAAGEIMAQPQDVADLVRHHFADIILRHAQHRLVRQFVAGEQFLQAMRHLPGEHPRIQFAARRGCEERHAQLRRCLFCRPSSPRPLPPSRAATPAPGPCRES